MRKSSQTTRDLGMPVVPPVSKTYHGLLASALGIHRRTGPPRSHSSSKWPNSLRSSKVLMSFSGSNWYSLAFSSQKGVPVSGWKCQRTTSRTWASSCCLACWVCVAVAAAVTFFLSLDGVQRSAGVDVQDHVVHHGRHLRRLADRDLLRRRVGAAVAEDVEVAGVGADEHLPIDRIGRAPGRFLEVVLPQLRARPGVQAVEVAGQLGGV